MILYNTAMQDLESDNHWRRDHIDGPSTGVTGNAAQLSRSQRPTGVQATWANGAATLVRGDVMAVLVARPVGRLHQTDVTAPGVQVLAGMTPQPRPGNITVGPPGQFYQAIAGRRYRATLSRYCGAGQGRPP
jgi:hypothetical protein